MRGTLFVVQGKNKGKRLSLRKDKAQTIVGRDVKCDVRIEDAGVSRRHFCILEQDEKFFLQDVGSSNGTFVNNQQTLWQEITNGDHIACGATELQFLIENDLEDSLYPENITQGPRPHTECLRTQPLQQMSVQENSFLPETVAEENPPDIIVRKDRQEPPFSGYRDTRRLSKTLATLYKVLELLNSQLELKQLLEVLVDTVLEVAKAERGCLIIKKSPDANPETIAFRSKQAIYSSGIPISRTIVNFAIDEGIATLSSDAMTDLRFRKNAGSSIALGHIRSVMCVPLEGRERTLGAIYVDSLINCYAFDNEDLELLRAIGRQAGLAVDRALLQEEITRSEQKYRTIFAKAPFCIALISPSGRILDVNPLGMKNLGLIHSDVDEHSILEILPQGKSTFQKLLQNREQVEVKEFHTQNFDGESVILHLQGIPLMDDKGAFEGSMLIAEDITEAKRLQSQVIHQDKMATVGLLGAGVAHEFNNIIAGMKGYSQLVLKNRGDPHELAKIVVGQCERAMEVVDRLLNFSRRKDTPRELVNLDELLEDVFELVRRELLKNNIYVLRRFNETPPILAQPGQLQQVFLNLVLNAMHAMKKEGQLTVSLHSRNGWAEIEFQDTGMGIPPKVLSRIFEPFFTTKGSHGTGLGLAVSYSIIQEYGGEITVKSRENEGTTFTIHLPLVHTDVTEQ